MARDNGTSDTADQEDSISFEDALAQLTAVVESLEKGELPLEDALRIYEQGARLTRLCEQQLKDAELRITRWQDDTAEEM